MTVDPNTTVNARTLDNLLRRIGRHLQEAHCDRAWAYQPDHPATMLAEAEEMLSELGRGTGLIRLPSPVRKRDH